MQYVPLYNVATEKRRHISRVLRALSVYAFQSHALLFDAVESVSEMCSEYAVQLPDNLRTSHNM